jgi:hypothetical protein
MAITASAVWEVRSTATAGNTNGGFFKTGATGTDFSQQNAAQYALTGITTGGAGATFLTASAAADMVGNGCYIVSGTNFTVGWYEITSVSAGVSVTVDRACCTGVGSNGVINIGGALSLASTLDDDVFEAFIGGNTVYVKNGTYTIGESISVASASSTATAPVNFIGYNSTRGDDPRGSTRPTFACGANTFTLGQYWIIRGIQVTTTAAAGFVLGTGSTAYFCKCTNSSTTTARNAFNGSSEYALIGCEAVSLNGTAIISALGNKIVGCHVHDSDIGFQTSTGTGRLDITNCIFEAIRTAAIDIALTSTSLHIQGCTIYGGETPLGIGVRMGGSVANVTLNNNIIYGCVTGISHTGLDLKSNNGVYNCFFNNTTNATNYTLDSTDLTVNPTFTGASQLSGATATTSGSILTQSGGDFSTVTDGTDIIRVVSGTGVTIGLYTIASHTSTTVTVNGTLGTSSAGDVVWSIPVGHNFAVGTNMRAAGYPGAIPGSESTSYLDIGAVQRQESSASGLSRARFQRSM